MRAEIGGVPDSRRGPSVTLPLVDLPTPTSQAPRPLLDGPADNLRAWREQRGQPALRARQIRRWLLHGGAESFAQMSDLPRGLREELSAAFVPLGTQVARHLTADDDTHKLLL